MLSSFKASIPHLIAMNRLNDVTILLAFMSPSTFGNLKGYRIRYREGARFIQINFTEHILWQ